MPIVSCVLALLLLPLLLFGCAGDKVCTTPSPDYSNTSICSSSADGGGKNKSTKSTRLPSVMQPPPMVEQPVCNPELEQKTQSIENEKSKKEEKKESKPEKDEEKKEENKEEEKKDEEKKEGEKGEEGKNSKKEEGEKSQIKEEEKKSEKV
ncbi:hypothetical protein PENTCL1PPCAC_19922 [Pristionchus entomophagus]|uniref:Uncharacterized protein n=1 Tax=Pristionchus entomophagus TaxID=358040 RepID=A0AAV5TU54_9BILA|nr:hypothetical protein PENTCL1PPCAC_19922 [Pristionchus entomophagus]